MAMKFGLHNSSWLDGRDPAEAFEAVKAKAQWAENHGFVWFSVMDHMIQIPGVGAPDEPILEGWTVLAALAAVTRRIRLATLCTAIAYRNPAASVDAASGRGSRWKLPAIWRYSSSKNPAMPSVSRPRLIKSIRRASAPSRVTPWRLR
jgi:Luciferase-like monooxygenase